jgi:thioredoxin-dependent peroxiredoxin
MSAFRDRLSEFAGTHAQVLGISMDDLDTQKRFAESLKATFPLLADPEGKVARAYGVAGNGYAERVTFVIDPGGKVKAVLEGREALDPAGALSACGAR